MNETENKDIDSVAAQPLIDIRDVSYAQKAYALNGGQMGAQVAQQATAGRAVQYGLEMDFAKVVKENAVKRSKMLKLTIDAHLSEVEMTSLRRMAGKYDVEFTGKDTQDHCASRAATKVFTELLDDSLGLRNRRSGYTVKHIGENPQKLIDTGDESHNCWTQLDGRDAVRAALIRYNLDGRKLEGLSPASIRITNSYSKSLSTGQSTRHNCQKKFQDCTVAADVVKCRNVHDMTPQEAAEGMAKCGAKRAGGFMMYHRAIMLPDVDSLVLPFTKYVVRIDRAQDTITFIGPNDVQDPYRHSWSRYESWFRSNRHLTVTHNGKILRYELSFVTAGLDHILWCIVPVTTTNSDLPKPVHVVPGMSAEAYACLFGYYYDQDRPGRPNVGVVPHKSEMMRGKVVFIPMDTYNKCTNLTNVQKKEFTIDYSKRSFIGHLPAGYQEENRLSPDDINFCAVCIYNKIYDARYSETQTLAILTNLHNKHRNRYNKGFYDRIKDIVCNSNDEQHSYTFVDQERAYEVPVHRIRSVWRLLNWLPERCVSKDIMPFRPMLFTGTTAVLFDETEDWTIEAKKLSLGVNLTLQSVRDGIARELSKGIVPSVINPFPRCIKSCNDMSFEPISMDSGDVTHANSCLVDSFVVAYRYVTGVNASYYSVVTHVTNHPDRLRLSKPYAVIESLLQNKMVPIEACYLIASAYNVRINLLQFSERGGGGYVAHCFGNSDTDIYLMLDKRRNHVIPMRLFESQYPAYVTAQIIENVDDMLQIPDKTLEVLAEQISGAANRDKPDALLYKKHYDDLRLVSQVCQDRKRRNAFDPEGNFLLPPVLRHLNFSWNTGKVLDIEPKEFLSRRETKEGKKQTKQNESADDSNDVIMENTPYSKEYHSIHPSQLYVNVQSYVGFVQPSIMDDVLFWQRATTDPHFVFDFVFYDLRNRRVDDIPPSLDLSHGIIKSGGKLVVRINLRDKSLFDALRPVVDEFSTVDIVRNVEASLLSTDVMIIATKLNAAPCDNSSPLNAPSLEYKRRIMYTSYNKAIKYLTSLNEKGERAVAFGVHQHNVMTKPVYMWSLVDHTGANKNTFVRAPEEVLPSPDLEIGEVSDHLTGRGSRFRKVSIYVRRHLIKAVKAIPLGNSKNKSVFAMCSPELSYLEKAEERCRLALARMDNADIKNDIKDAVDGQNILEAHNSDASVFDDADDDIDVHEEQEHVDDVLPGNVDIAPLFDEEVSVSGDSEASEIVKVSPVRYEKGAPKLYDHYTVTCVKACEEFIDYHHHMTKQVPLEALDFYSALSGVWNRGSVARYVDASEVDCIMIEQGNEHRPSSTVISEDYTHVWHPGRATCRRNKIKCKAIPQGLMTMEEFQKLDPKDRNGVVTKEMDPYLSDQIVTKHSNTLNVCQIEPIPITIVQAVSGAGKTTRMIDEFKNGDVIIEPTKHACEDTGSRLMQKHYPQMYADFVKETDPDVRKRKCKQVGVFTGMALLLNPTAVNTLWVDEMTLHHAGSIFLTALVCKASAIRVIGDRGQTYSFSSSVSYYFKHSKIDEMFPIEDKMTVSYRSPQVLVPIIDQLYKDAGVLSRNEAFTSKNPKYGNATVGKLNWDELKAGVRKALNAKRTVAVISYSKADRETANKHFRKDLQKPVIKTVTQMQGSQADVIFMIRSNTCDKAQGIYANLAQLLTGITRAKEEFIYMTNAENDYLSLRLKEKRGF